MAVVYIGAVLGFWWCITGFVAALANNDRVVEFMGVGPFTWLLGLILWPFRRARFFEAYRVEFKDGRVGYFHGNHQRNKFWRKYSRAYRQEYVASVTLITWKEYIHTKGKKRP